MNIIDKFLIVFRIILIFLIISLAGLVCYEAGHIKGVLDENVHVQEAFELGKESATNEVSSYQIKSAIQYGLSYCNMTIDDSNIVITTVE